MTINPNYVPALYNEATIYATTDPVPAISLYRHIVKIQPTAPTAYLNLGFLEITHGEPKQGVKSLATAVKPDRGADLASARAPADVGEVTVCTGHDHHALTSITRRRRATLRRRHHPEADECHASPSLSAPDAQPEIPGRLLPQPGLLPVVPGLGVGRAA